MYCMYNTPPTKYVSWPVPWINGLEVLAPTICLGVSQINKMQDICENILVLSGLLLCPCSYLCARKEQHSLRWLPPEMEADFISCTHVSELMYKPASNCLSFFSSGSLICHISFCGSALRTSPQTLFSLYLHIDLLSRGCFTQRSN